MVNTSLGMHSSESLLNAVFYLNGKGLCLRGVQEHHNLRFSQFVREENPPRYIYVECGSKNHSGGLSDVGQNKMVPIYSIREAGERDHFFLLELYLSKIPLEMMERDQAFIFDQ